MQMAKRRTIGICFLKICRDRPGIENNTIIIGQNRYTALTGKGNPILFGEAPWDGFERQAFMCERHLDSPAIGTEATFKLGAGEIVKFQSHAKIPA